MKSSIQIFSLLVSLVWSGVLPAGVQVNVTQEHNNPSRDGVYIDAGFTPSAAANLTRDLNFDGTISGAVYAQPLYIEGGPNGPMIIAVTESNNVYALNATTGLPIWSRTDIGSPVSNTPCGGFFPTGITGTPVVDLTSRRLFFDALINGSPIKHFIYSLNVDTGVTTPGWPVDVNATASYNGINFVSLAQEERGGLALVNGIVYISYSGYDGDCGTYHGWIVGIPENNPSSVLAWAPLWLVRRAAHRELARRAPAQLDPRDLALFTSFRSGECRGFRLGLLDVHRRSALAAQQGKNDQHA